MVQTNENDFFSFEMMRIQHSFYIVLFDSFSFVEGKKFSLTLILCEFSLNNCGSLI